MWCLFAGGDGDAFPLVFAVSSQKYDVACNIKLACIHFSLYSTPRILIVNLMMYKRDNLEDYFLPIQSRLHSIDTQKETAEQERERDLNGERERETETKKAKNK